ncbi:DUF6442 family protein [Facklamia miroungae]|uniref:Uncharacterized protein n=1 Tax=Facklamia miroungae TaxID=120956 RepID=A0A1G7NW16_9LACT|nr:DUF6442 family protein [Facklamia miroungae]NKZ28488.1 hypothetical protein [Facklamia miroungae]SDF78236.1 hypothetical protein SAMN05421791_10127 [Facklamia miroungae]
MKKEDILKKAQIEQKDEREEEINTKAFRIGWISVSVVMLLLIFLRSIFNESATDILIILMAQVAAASFYQYSKMPDKKIYLVGGIVAILAIILSFASLLSSYGVY